MTECEKTRRSNRHSIVNSLTLALTPSNQIILNQRKPNFGHDCLSSNPLDCQLAQTTWASQRCFFLLPLAPCSTRQLLSPFACFRINCCDMESSTVLSSLMCPSTVTNKIVIIRTDIALFTNNCRSTEKRQNFTSFPWRDKVKLWLLMST